MVRADEPCGCCLNMFEQAAVSLCFDQSDTETRDEPIESYHVIKAVAFDVDFLRQPELEG